MEEETGVGDASGVGRGVGVTGTNTAAVSPLGIVEMAVAGSMLMNAITVALIMSPNTTAIGMNVDCLRRINSLGGRCQPFPAAI